MFVPTNCPGVCLVTHSVTHSQSSQYLVNQMKGKTSLSVHCREAGIKQSARQSSGLFISSNLSSLLKLRDFDIGIKTKRWRLSTLSCQALPCIEMYFLTTYIYHYCVSFPIFPFISLSEHVIGGDTPCSSLTQICCCSCSCGCGV